MDGWCQDRVNYVLKKSFDKTKCSNFWAESADPKRAAQIFIARTQLQMGLTARRGRLHLGEDQIFLTAQTALHLN